MKLPIPTSPNSIKRYLDEVGIIPQKKLCQNFLWDVNILKKIVKEANLSKEEVVVEIGGGLGHLTYFLAKEVKEVLCVDIDEKLVKLMKENFSELFNNIRIVELNVLDSKHALNHDFVREIKGAASSNNFKYKVVSNLPYNISAPLIVDLLELDPSPTMMIVTVQKEVADRLKAKPGTSDYGPLTLNIQLYADVKTLFNISPKSFYPKPKVYSTVVKIEPHPVPSELKDKALFKKVVRAVFNMRRKTISNSLKNSSEFDLDKNEVEKILEKANIPSNTRGEILDMTQFITLTNIIKDYLEERKK